MPTLLNVTIPIFLRDGMREEHRVASMRHAEAAITCGQDDATAALPSAWRGGTAQHCHYLNRRYPLVLLRRIHFFLAFGGQANALFNGLSAPYASVHLIHGVRQLIWHLRWGTFIAVAIRMRLLPDGKLCRPVQVSVLHT